jgi:hypothetical protein
VNAHVRDDFMIRQASFRSIVDLGTGDDVDFASRRRQMEREVGKDLARRRVIGMEESIDENQSTHSGRAFIAGHRRRPAFASTRRCRSAFREWAAMPSPEDRCNLRIRLPRGD